MRIEDKFFKYLNIYKSAPSFIKKGVGKIYLSLPPQIRYGSKYKYYNDLVRLNNSLNEDELRTLQLEKLNQVLAIAKEEVPYYKEILRDTALPLNSLSEINSIPLLTKDILRSRGSSMLNPRIPDKNILVISTSGTSGEPLKLYYEKGKNRVKELLFMLDQWKRVDFQDNDLRVVFRSSLLRNRVNDKLWEYDPIKNRYFFSSYDINEKNLPIYIKKINEIRPKYLHVYPSVLTIIASFMKQNNYSPIPGLKGILCGSENTFPHQIKLFEDVFKTKVYRWYGLGEMVALGGSCEYTHNYHMYPAYSFVELIDEEGNQITEIGKKGEIVGTSFDEQLMPLIRYRTGDFAYYAGQRCSKCGRYGLLLSEIEGRSQEKVYDFDMNEYSLGPFLFGIHDEFWGKISAVQFQQYTKGEILILGSSAMMEKDEIENYLLETFEPRFKNNFKLSVRAETNISRGNAAKHKYLIQKLKT